MCRVRQQPCWRRITMTLRKAKLTSCSPHKFFVDHFWAALSTLSVHGKYARLLMPGGSRHSVSTDAGKCELYSLEQTK